MNLEKDKKDQSKYSLSNPKLPALDMKWANNRATNVVEWANIPKFSTLDCIVTPLRHLELSFDDVLVDMIFGYTKLHNHREQAGISFEITYKRICLFLNKQMLLFNWCHTLLDRKIYWEGTPDTFV